MSPVQITIITTLLLLAQAVAFVPSRTAHHCNSLNNADAFLRSCNINCNRIQLNLFGGTRSKAAKSKQEDLELTREVIMKHFQNMEANSVVDEEDDDDDSDRDGNSWNEAVATVSDSEALNGSEDPIQKIKSFGQKLRDKLQIK